MNNGTFHIHKKDEIFWELASDNFKLKESNFCGIISTIVNIKESISPDCDAILLCVYEEGDYNCTRLMDAIYASILLIHQLTLKHIEELITQYPKCRKITAVPIKLNSEIKIIEKRR